MNDTIKTEELMRWNFLPARPHKDRAYFSTDGKRLRLIFPFIHKKLEKYIQEDAGHPFQAMDPKCMIYWEGSWMTMEQARRDAGDDALLLGHRAGEGWACMHHNYNAEIFVNSCCDERDVRSWLGAYTNLFRLYETVPFTKYILGGISEKDPWDIATRRGDTLQFHTFPNSNRLLCAGITKITGGASSLDGLIGCLSTLLPIPLIPHHEGHVYYSDPYSPPMETVPYLTTKRMKYSGSLLVVNSQSLLAKLKKRVKISSTPVSSIMQPGKASLIGNFEFFPSRDDAGVIIHRSPKFLIEITEKTPLADAETILQLIHEYIAPPKPEFISLIHLKIGFTASNPAVVCYSQTSSLENTESVVREICFCGDQFGAVLACSIAQFYKKTCFPLDLEGLVLYQLKRAHRSLNDLLYGGSERLPSPVKYAN